MKKGNTRIITRLEAATFSVNRPGTRRVPVNRSIRAVVVVDLIYGRLESDVSTHESNGMQIPGSTRSFAVSLRRAAGILGTFAAILGLVSLRIENASAPVTVDDLVAESETSRPIATPPNRVTQTAADSVVSGEVHVAVAEVHSLSSREWERLLAQLAAELHLGLTIEVLPPATTSDDPPPPDSLSRLMWAQRLLQRYGIELKVEHDALRMRPSGVSADPPLEARRTNNESLHNDVSPLRRRQIAEIASFSEGQWRTILHGDEADRRCSTPIESDHVDRTRTS